MAVLVISGTGTGVGKTVVTAAIAALALERGESVAVIKPAQTGAQTFAPGDLDEVRRLCGGRLTLVEGARFPDPLSPAAAARRCGKPPADLEAVAKDIAGLAAEHALVLVEGAGGLLVRFDEAGSTVASLARAIAARVLIVAEPGLGTLNATTLTLEAVAHRKLDLAGIVIGAWPAEPDLASWSNVGDLETLASRPLAGALAAGSAGLTGPAFQEAARAGLAAAFGGRFDAAAFHRTATAALTRE